MNRLRVADTPLAGLRLVERQRLSDTRGSLARLFCAAELHGAGWPGPIAQLNHSVTARAGTVRGLHWQRAPHGEAKLVSCLRGSVWDVAVDLRAGSATHGRWHAQRLAADNGCALLIPAGFAHGFQALEDGAELLYCHSAAFVAAAEDGIHALDRRLAIDWPLPVGDLSARDAGWPRPALSTALPTALPTPSATALPTVPARARPAGAASAAAQTPRLSPPAGALAPPADACPEGVNA